jgi:thiol-disulfide isomerase/thioredoxin
MNTRFIGIAAVVLIAAQAAIGIHLYQQNDRIPQQQGKTFTGSTINVYDPRDGYLTVVNFWASSCLPCIKEMPDFIELHKDYKNQKFALVGITMPFDQSDLSLAILKRFDIQWHNILDTQGKHTEAFGGIKAVPTTFLLDHEGHPLWKHEGPVDFKQLRQQINHHLTASS